mgnify:FL=1
MKLNEDQKNILREGKKTEFYKIMKMINDDALVNFSLMLAKVDVRTEVWIKMVEDSQIYVKARQDFLTDIERHTAGQVYSQSIPWTN